MGQKDCSCRGERQKRRETGFEETREGERGRERKEDRKDAISLVQLHRKALVSMKIDSDHRMRHTFSQGKCGRARILLLASVKNTPCRAKGRPAGPERRGTIFGRSGLRNRQVSANRIRNGRKGNLGTFSWTESLRTKGWNLMPRTDKARRGEAR